MEMHFLFHHKTESTNVSILFIAILIPKAAIEKFYRNLILTTTSLFIWGIRLAALCVCPGGCSEQNMFSKFHPLN